MSQKDDVKNRKPLQCVMRTSTLVQGAQLTNSSLEGSGMCVILVFMLLANCTRHGSSQQHREGGGGDQEWDREGGRSGDNQDGQQHQVDEADVCSCKPYSPTMKTVVVKSTWSETLIKIVAFYSQSLQTIIANSGVTWETRCSLT